MRAEPHGWPQEPTAPRHASVAGRWLHWHDYEHSQRNPDGTPAFGHTHSEPPAAGAGGDVGTDDEGATE